MSKSALRRRALIGACLVSTALSPALARADEPGDIDAGRLDDMSHELRDPMNQAKAAGALSALTGALLSTDITPLTRTMDQFDGGRSSRDLPPDATLGDVAGPDARALPYEIARNTPRAMSRMADMLGAAEDLRPQLKAMGRQLKDTLRRQGLAGN